MPTPPEEIKTTTVVESKPAPFPAPVGAVETKVTITQTSHIEAFGRWGAGLISGFIRGGAHAVASGTAIQVLEPAEMSEALTRYGVLFLCHGVISTAMYLQAHPIPDEWNEDTSEDRRAPRE